MLLSPPAVFIRAERKGGYMTTATGVKFYPYDPRPEEIRIEDIAYGLSNAPRWAGQTRIHYPVLAHVLEVSDYCMLVERFDGLMHDSAEAFFCDLSSPIKRDLTEYVLLEHQFMTCAAKKFGFIWPCPPGVKLVDEYVMLCEAAALFEPRPAYEYTLQGKKPRLDEYPGKVRPRLHSCYECRKTLREEFLERFKHYQ